MLCKNLAIEKVCTQLFELLKFTNNSDFTFLKKPYLRSLNQSTLIVCKRMESKIRQSI